MTLNNLDDLMHEDEVMEKWRTRFAADELRLARQSGTIEWYDLRKGPHYTERQLLNYLETRKKGCQKVKPLIDEGPKVIQPGMMPPEKYLNSMGNGSAKNIQEVSNIVTGMKPQIVESAVAALEQSL